DPPHGGQEGRPPGELRPPQSDRRHPARLPEAPRLLRADRGHRRRDRTPASRAGREGSAHQLHRRVGDARAVPARRGGIRALRLAGDRARGADLYVTLEPCDHHGRTPPCTEAVLASGVRRVVIGSVDPNPLVHGRGIRRLRAAGIRVDVGVLGDACDAANEMWFKFITRKLPWVMLKAAVTLDGKIATGSGDSRWVSGRESRMLVHVLRDEMDAVLVGVGTALADDPRLTARLPRVAVGGSRVATGVAPRDPVRVVVDSTARLPPTARSLRQRSTAPTLVACTL